MANVNRPVGFTLVGSMGGYMPKGRWYLVYSDSSVSDVVTEGDATILDSQAGYVTVYAAAGDTALLGVALTTVASATTHQAILVCDDPEAVYKGQCSSGTTPAQADVLTTVDISGTTGIMQVDEDGVAHPVITILGLEGNPANSWADYADVLFKIQRHVLASSTVEGG